MKRGSVAPLGGITLLGALLRIWSPGRIGLSGDEVLFLDVAKLPSPRAIVDFLYAHESHPPLYYLLAHLAGSVAGNLPGAMSFLSILASITAIPAAWWLASLSGRRAAGVIAAVLVALSVPLAALSVQLRPYSIFTLLLLCATGALIRGSEPGRTAWRAVWAGLMLLLLYLHHLAIIVFGTQLIAMFFLTRKRVAPAARLSSWLPWIAVVVLLAIPDLALLRHQHQVTGYIPISGTKAFVPLREVAWLALTFPGELLLGIVAAFVGIIWSWRRTANGGPRAVVVVLGTLSGTFLLQCFFLMAAGYRQSVLVAHLVLPFAPLALAAEGIVLSNVFAERRRAASFLWSQCGVVCVTLSALFTVGWSKANLDLMARYIDAEALPGDLVILVPGPFGGVVSRNLDASVSRIDFPEMGSPPVYPFDGHWARILDPARMAMSQDSIARAASDGKRVWFIVPTKWLSDTIPEDEPSGASETEALRDRANVLRQSLQHQLGSPVAAISIPEHSWNLEALTVELFGEPAVATHE
jgi:hypothetical protein